MKKVLLGTTGLLGTALLAGGLGMATVDTANAAEINAGGALDITIGGRGDFGIRYSDSALRNTAGTTNLSPTPPVSGSAAAREWDFRNDLRLDLRAEGIGDATGIAYGFFSRLRSTSGSGDPSNIDGGIILDQTYVYIGSSEGEFGQVRLGTQDPVTDLLKITGAAVARGTGGIDGNMREGADIRIADSGKATKAMYLTPVIAGFQAGADFAFNDDDRGRFTADNFGEQSSVGSVAANWQGEFSGVGLGVYGGYAYGNAPVNDVDNRSGYQFGAEASAFGVGVAGSYGRNSRSTGATGISNFWNVGIGTELGGVGLSYSFQFTNQRGGGSNQNHHYVSADTAILPGVTLRGDIGYVEQRYGDGVDGILEVRTVF
ncbi:MAG: porin [Pseudomonadota bacterium]